MRARLAVALLSTLLATACGAKVVRETLFDTPEVRVELRRIESRQKEPSAYQHPVTISDVRIAHILASLAYRDAKGRQRPAIRTEHVYPLAEGIAKAVARATPEDEIAAATFPSDPRLVVFDTDRVTALRLFFEEPFLVIEFYRIEDRLQKNPRRPDAYSIPLQAPNWASGVSLVPGKAQTLSGRRTLHIDWRAPYYAKPVSLHLGGGKIRRRTILMEAEPKSEAPSSASPPVPDELVDAQVRALDQLEATRRAGLITEAEFKRRRALILQGRLDEAGYGEAP